MLNIEDWRKRSLKMGFAVAALTAAGALQTSGALAQTRAETLIVVAEEGPASLDIDAANANVPTHEVSWNIYDRLITHGMKTLPDGTPSYDFTQFKPELAESWEIAPDRSSVTFHLRKDATFHDGSPVTAEDVKWSFDRAVSVGGFPGIQMGASDMKSPDQFVVVDPLTFKVNFPKPNKLELPNLAVPIAMIVNSKLAKQHATATDPWALEWVGKNDAGGGAYMVESWKPGSEIVFKRFDAWKSGPLPAMKKVIERQIEFGGHAPRFAGKGRRRSLLQSAPERLRRTRQGGQAEGHRNADRRRAALHGHERHQAALRQSEGPAGDGLCDPLSGYPAHGTV